MDIGAAIKRLRARAGLSQKQLAALAGIDPGNLSRIERNKQEVPIDRLERIANAMRIKVSDLISDAELNEGDPRKAAWMRMFDQLTDDQRDAALRLLAGSEDRERANGGN